LGGRSAASWRRCFNLRAGAARPLGKRRARRLVSAGETCAPESDSARSVRAVVVQSSFSKRRSERPRSLCFMSRAGTGCFRGLCGRVFCRRPVRPVLLASPTAHAHAQWRGVRVCSATNRIPGRASWMLENSV